MNRIPTPILKQIGLLLIILFIAIILIWQLWYFVPGLLGAITLYICVRKFYFYLTIIKRWKQWMAISVLMFAIFLLLVMPVFGIVQLLIPKINFALNNTSIFKDYFQQLISIAEKYIPEFKISEEQLQTAVQAVTATLLRTLSGTMHVLVNVIIAFFLLYFMLCGGRAMEKGIKYYMPLKAQNSKSIWQETKNMVISNAVGIPLLIICQCLVAILGYWFFNVEQYVFWGILTGVASIIPIVGCMIVYVPLCLVMFSNGNQGSSIALLLYSMIVISNIDNVLRFTILKKIGDVHPIITVFGVIIGLQIFGIMGLIFGPLLLAYFILLFKVYYREFHPTHITTKFTPV
jgi:predicted PurR-regulated permease PerM